MLTIGSVAALAAPSKEQPLLDPAYKVLQLNADAVANMCRLFLPKYCTKIAMLGVQ